MKARTSRSTYIVLEHRTVAAGEEVVRSFLAAEEAAEDLKAEKNKQHRLHNDIKSTTKALTLSLLRRQLSLTSLLLRRLLRV